MFGQNKSFGSSAFGSSSSSTGSSLFGSNQNKPTSLFGSTTGNTSGGGLFGNANKPTTSLFGSNTNQSSNLFGSPQQNQGSSLFGSSNTPNKSIFGSSNTSTGGGGLFGSSNTTNSSGGGLFGSSSGGGGSLFGSSSSSTVSGTTIKFEPHVGQDTMIRNGTSQNISTKNMCITAMPKYESKSIEELRIEDYLANRKTPGTGTTASGSGLFGSSTSNQSTSGGLFGSSTPQKSLFGSNTNSSSPFGGSSATTGSSLFGGSNSNQQQQGSSLFGSKPAASGGLFGANTSGNTSAFGSSNTGSLFGGNNTNQQQGSSLFGNTNNQQQGSSLFGNTSSTSTGGGLFGSTQPQQQQSSSLFGGNTGGSTFGQSAANTSGSLFGNTSNQNAGSSLFGGKPAQTSGGFGFGGSNTNTGSTFGQPAAANTGSSLFGNTASKPGGLFGSTNTSSTGTGLFGSQPAANTGTGLFGSTAQPAQPASTFGVPAQAQAVVAQPQAAPVPVIGVPAEVLQMQANMKSLQSQLTNVPYGDSPLLKFNTSLNEQDLTDSSTNTKRQIRLLAAKKGASTISSPSTKESMKSSFISNNVSKIMSDLSPAVKSNDVTKDLNYISKEAPPTLGRGLRSSMYNNTSITNQTLNNSSVVEKTVDSALNVTMNGSSNRLGVRGSMRRSNLKQLDLSVLSDSSKYSLNNTASNRDNDADALPIVEDNGNDLSVNEHPIQLNAQRQQNRDKVPSNLNLDATTDDSTSVVTRTTTNTSVSTTSVVSQETTNSEINKNKSAAGVRLSKSDYFTIPSIAEMRNLVKNGKVVLEDGLTIGRFSYGSVFWPGKTELSDMVLDEVVVFRHREVTVYPNEESKPEEGYELNKPAEVTLERIWYTDKKTKKEIRDVIQLANIGWRENLERKSARMGATFKDYRPETGSWVFQVEHFSKYGLLDDDEEDDHEPMDTVQSAAPLKTIDLNITSDVQNQVQRQRIHMKQSSNTNRESIISINYLNEGAKRSNYGLGGGEHDKEDVHFGNSTIEFQEDDECDQPEEKKPKLEILEQLEYESSKYLKNIVEMKAAAPKCVEAARRFEGGSRSKTDTVGYGKSKMIDMSIVNGRSCRVGWSSMGSLVCSNQPVSNEILWATVDRTTDADEDSLISLVEASMNLAKVKNEVNLPKCFDYSDNFGEIIDQYKKASNGQDASVWALCDSLFPTHREDGWAYERGESVGEWLRKEAVRNNTNIDGSDAGTMVWSKLAVGDIESAFDLASSNDLFNLATSLYSAFVCPEMTRKCYRKMIDDWKKNGVLHTLNPSILKCYLILAGVSYTEWNNNGKKHVVNCLDGLHWTQALGIHVWYLRGWNGLEQAYEQYVDDVRAGRAQSCDGDLYGELIRLACESKHSMEVVLDCAVGESPHDYYLMWHTWVVLKSVGYRTMSKSAEIRMHRGYSAQLEALGLMREALFVLEHVENDTERLIDVQNLLERIAFRTNGDELLKKMCDEGLVSKEMISAAQYIYLKTIDNSDAMEMFELATIAKFYKEAQCLFVDDIAPNAVVTSDMETLSTACELIEPLEEFIEEWGARGKIYVDYCKMVRYIENGEENEAHDLIEIIEDRLHAPIFEGTVQKLALQTIVRQLFEYRTSDSNELPEWVCLLGARQMHKMIRDNVPSAFGKLSLEY